LIIPDTSALREGFFDATSNGQVCLTSCRELFDNLDVDEARLDRIEKLLEGHGRMLMDHDLAIAAIDETIARAERANEAARERFEAEGKRLLTAQILMNGAMQKMALAMDETTGKLDALINTVDGIIHPKHPS
jgi:hypothetical protein